MTICEVVIGFRAIYYIDYMAISSITQERKKADLVSASTFGIFFPFLHYASMT